MYCLGINGGFGGGYQDACAVLLHNGHLISAIEEERLNRIKFSPGQLPVKAIQYVLQHAGITIKDIDVVAMHGSTWQGNVQEKIAGFFTHNFGYSPAIQLFHHHTAHAASSYYASGFDDALIISIDNSGDGISTQICTGINGKIEILQQVERPNSLGSFYSLITQYCGFIRDADEYKLMGLSAYGTPQAISLEDVLNYTGEGNYRLNTDYLVEIKPGTPFPSKQQVLYSPKLQQLLGFANRLPGDAVSDNVKNLAAAAQQQLERVMTEVLTYWINKTGLSKVCLAGGVSLNCLMNGKLLKLTEVSELYVPPFAGDMGVAVGCAYLASTGKDIAPVSLKTCYTGKEFSDEDIEACLQKVKVPYKKINNPAKIAAELVDEGKIIAWMQGGSEIGPRALGNRSILANPALAGVKEKINAAVKFREDYRPFCPAVLEEDAHLYFDMKNVASPYMTITYPVKQAWWDKLAGVVHHDKTARIQTVNNKQNPLFYNYLLELKKLTGYGVSINTSFNTRNHPMVNSPYEALETYFSSGLDALVIGNFLLQKDL